jgi:aspartate/methionine/tyrosine aminotransferase
MANSLAVELNEIILKHSPFVLGMISELGRELYFPKGILTQTAEAKQKAKRHNATIGIAKENGEAMHLNSIMRHFADVSPDELLPYAPSLGRADLRAKWKQMQAEKNASLRDKAVSLPVVTAGITHGLSIVADMFVESDDLVLLPDKYWGNYNMVFGVRRDATMAHYPFFAEDGRGFDTEGFRRTVFEHSSGPNVKIVVVLNFPHNPTGYSVTPAEGEAICDALLDAADGGKCDIVAVCDDAYFGLLHEPNVLRESLFARLADLHENVLAIKLDGVTKEDFAWGLRVGFITFGIQGGTRDTYDALEKKVGGLIRGTISNCPHHSQSILMKAMSDGDYAKQRAEKQAILAARAAKVKEVLSRSKYAAAWTPYPFNSGYFMCLRLKSLHAETFRLRLLEESGIGVIASGGSDIRVAFSCLEVDEIGPLFDAMFECAREMVCSKTSCPTG